MDTFLSKHAKDVVGTLSGFDRLVFRGTLRSLVYVGGMKSYLYSAGLLLKDFAGHALDITKRLKDASLIEAKQANRPVPPENLIRPKFGSISRFFGGWELNVLDTTMNFRENQLRVKHSLSKGFDKMSING
ncbi:MAG: hypothetical protein H7832_12125 [Magnetococcus sp. DMHC-6]